MYAVGTVQVALDVSYLFSLRLRRYLLRLRLR